MTETKVHAYDRSDGTHVKQHSRTIEGAPQNYQDELPPEGTQDITPAEPAAPTTLKRSVRYETWDLNAKGNGTVTYTRYKLPGDSDYRWANDIGTVTRREKGGTYKADERHASSAANIEMPVGTKFEKIVVSYSHGSKSGSSREYKTLQKYVPDPENPGRWKAEWSGD